uniref:RCC1-like domain-containing protein n=1 Tax=Megaselia scalaris TaxID=36166 RepID=T1GKR3_MEGSC
MGKCTHGEIMIMVGFERQQGSGNTQVNKKPSLVVGLDKVFVNRVACGSSHSIAWGLPQSPIEEGKKGPVPFLTTKDPLGGNSLGIYDSEVTPNISTPISKQSSKQPSLSEIIMSLETLGARQTALNYILNAMSIIQARHLIVSSLTSHSKGGGEAPADNTDPVIQEPSPTEIGQSATMSAAMSSSAGPLSAFQSLTGSLSLSSVSSCGGTNPNQKLSKMSTSAMSVIMAATMTHEEQMIEAAHNNGLDDFTALLTESEAKSLIELLKLNVAGRFGLGSQYTNSWQTISDTLIALASNSSSISSMLIETCITELEDLCTSRQCLFGKMPKSVIQETSHPYVDDVTLTGHVRIPGAEALRLEFDTNCSTEKRNDPLVIFDGAGRIVATRSGRELAQWTPEIRIPGDEMRWKFTSDSSVNGWGWKFWIRPFTTFYSLVMALLDSKKINPGQSTVLIRLASALAQCSQLNSLTPTQRIWSLKKLHSILNSKNAPKHSEPVIVSILTPLIPEIYHQYEYEEPQVRGGMHLMHSEYFKTLVALACDMQLDSLIPQSDLHKWSWFRRYCTAVRVAQSLVHRVELPQQFCVEVRKKISEMLPSPSNVTIGTSMTTSSTSLSSSSSNNTPQPVTPSNFLTAHNLNRSCSNTDVQDLTEQCSNISQSQFVYIHEDHNLFKSEHDSQLLQWLNRRPEDWALSWGGASTIYGWGHNHRGQLGGLEGSRIKSPTPCEALSLLRPVQLAGGEQTLYAVTPDGKLFATGYGAGGRLGIGGTDSVATPTWWRGKHCLALTTDGEVFSWGEGEDGKLGHGNRMSYDRPKLIESLSGIGIVDIACGSAHSACITSSGQVLTWGKGRYGRLGHGDSEDQLRPKPVEALLCYRAVDIACGSGDAQTLCITDDDNVWSWGDGDYGKLGRGGSDGCKVPMKIESLSGLGVTKVECGSQFSVALTKSGAVYTFGKGDYHRLGHGNTDHVRRPKKIAALQGKKIISISTGSLHCVACSDTGEVFTWGDNDEGQLGDGTVSAIQRPRLVTALQGKHIVKVTCGSAHTLALSTSQLSEAARPPPNPPIEYDLVGELSPDALHARLVLLHHFSELYI